MTYSFISSDEQLIDFCQDLADVETIAFDTEFISENTYRPQLCLVQVATERHEAILDPIAIDDLRPFWERLAEPGHDVIVHAGRSEAEFCLDAIGRLPDSWFDVQIGAGLTGIEFPAGYGSLVSKLVGIPTQKLETRTDWTRRPLSDRQISYALDDARHLLAIKQEIVRRLEPLNRFDWWEDEMRHWCQKLQRDLRWDRWRKVSGSTGLDRRSLAILRELWQWREKVAQDRNKPAKWMLRDDLMVELARRKSANPKRIQAIRGMERRDMQRVLDDLVTCIQKALDLPEEDWPSRLRRTSPGKWTVLGQFLFSALGSLCREKQLSPGLVGSPNDVRAWLDYRHDPDAASREYLPQLAEGWRAEIVGRWFDDLLSGKISIRITNPWSDAPLGFEEE